MLDIGVETIYEHNVGLAIAALLARKVGRDTFTSGPDGYEAVHIHANPRFVTHWLE